MYRKLMVAGLAVVLGGCASGIDNGSDNTIADFVAPVGYQEAYRLAEEQARVCTQGAVTGNVYTDNRTAMLRVNSTFLYQYTIQQIDIAQVDADSSRVKVTMWKRGGWGPRHIEAIRQTLLRKSTLCESELPK